jgi:hypothetical protein
MARHYYRTNVPLPIMFLKWIGMGILVAIALLYDTCANGPKREAQARWDREHFNGWRLEAQTYETEHGLYYDKLKQETCTMKGYPGYPTCPAQQYFVDGKPTTGVSRQ